MAADAGLQGYLEFINTVPAPQQDLDFFSSLPWTNEYLDKNGPFKAIPFFPRSPQNDTSNRFFNTTAKTDDTIPHLLALMRKAPWTPPPPPSQNNTPDSPPRIPDFILLLHLGPGVCGFRDTLHGGVLAALFDEALGTCVEGIRHSVAKESLRLYTANLNVNYRAPVPAPGVVAVRTWLDKWEGRKWFIRAQLVGEDGGVMADAKGLWITERGAGGSVL